MIQERPPERVGFWDPVAVMLSVYERSGGHEEIYLVDDLLFGGCCLQHHRQICDPGRFRFGDMGLDFVIFYRLNYPEYDRESNFADQDPEGKRKTDRIFGTTNGAIKGAARDQKIKRRFFRIFLS